MDSIYAEMEQELPESHKVPKIFRINLHKIIMGIFRAIGPKEEFVYNECEDLEFE